LGICTTAQKQHCDTKQTYILHVYLLLIARLYIDSNESKLMQIDSDLITHPPLSSPIKGEDVARVINSHIKWEAEREELLSANR
jgi:hypothetical protein